MIFQQSCLVVQNSPAFSMGAFATEKRKTAFFVFSTFRSEAVGGQVSGIRRWGRRQAMPILQVFLGNNMGNLARAPIPAAFRASHSGKPWNAPPTSP
jgi:hypothetical protein